MVPDEGNRSPIETNDITWLPAWRLRQLICSRQISPVEVVDHFLNRIESLDPQLNAFVAVDEKRARLEAKRAEEAVMRHETLGRFHGIPISVKQFVQAEGLPLPNGTIASSDFVISELIRQAGGIIVGNTMLMWPPKTLGSFNPWDLSRVAAGSSSGAAAGTAAALTPIAIGSDGGGSTRLPAAYCGVVGLHPTVGRVPGHHDLTYVLNRTGWSASFGPICRDVRDAAEMLQTLTQPNWRALFKTNSAAPDYLVDLDQGVQGMRLAWSADLGYATRYYREESLQVTAEVRKATQTFEDLGAIVEEPAFAIEDYFEIFLGMVAYINSITKTSDPLVTTTPCEVEYNELLHRRQAMAMTCLKLFEHYDVLLCPTTPVIAPRFEEYTQWLARPSFSAEYTCLTGPFNLIGFPAITVPCGFVDQMPVSLQIIARPDEDAKVLRVAQAFLNARPSLARPAMAAH